MFLLGYYDQHFIVFHKFQEDLSSRLQKYALH